ncbi:hypothetical protein BV898_01924 [Hypsibius exemplaris]|uniref:Uncharacterized protein n=1 Tax=Hypsibius exemplaris TaxID=2072580 RepID=A0A1W0XA27_HYPEX|nr:hypothetical protein BV898_01924 [Hypsibius exemplaris]
MPAVAFFSATNGSHLLPSGKEHCDLILGAGAVTVSVQNKFGRGGIRLAEPGIEINKMSETFGDGKGPKAVHAMNPLPIIRRDVPIYQPSQLQQQPQYGTLLNASTDDQLAGNVQLQQQPHYGPTVQALAHSQPSTSAQ